MDWLEMIQTVKEIEYKDWSFKLYMDGPRPILQVVFTALDRQKGTQEIQHGRKWFLSPYMTKSEFVQTIFKAVLTAEEHEVREQFKYRGQSVFGPHFDVDILVDLAAGKATDLRAEAA